MNILSYRVSFYHNKRPSPQKSSADLFQALSSELRQLAEMKNNRAGVFAIGVLRSADSDSPSGNAACAE
jgi:hypothetical protein